MNLQEKITNGWEISAKGYSNIVQDDFHSPGREIWTDEILSRAPQKGPMEILDVGTGPGVFATILSLAGHHLTGIDISPKMLEQAKANSARYGVSPTYLLMNSQELTFAENSFDMIVSRDVVWIMEHPEEVYASWLRILKPGGRIVVFDSGHNKDDFLTKFDHNNEAYREEYRQKFGREPAVSFEQGQYEAARGWKRELKLTYESRPEWDVAALERLGYKNVCWENVMPQISYSEELRFQNEGKVYFRLCAAGKSGCDSG